MFKNETQPELTRTDEPIQDPPTLAVVENDAQTSDMEPAIQRVVDTWRTKLQDFENFVPPPASPFHYFPVDTASQISSSPGLALASTNIAPYNNWAEFKLEATDSSGGEQVIFTFEWQNASDVYALINIHAYLVLNGEIEAISGGGFFSGNTSEADTTYAELSMSVSDAPQVTLVSEQAVPPVTAVYDGYYSGGKIADPGPVFRGFDLQSELQIVPPGATVTLQIMVALSYTNDDGQVDYVFMGLDRKVLSPGVLIVVVS